MTIAAFRRLLDEIDTQGGPDAARANRLNLPDEGTEPTMTTTAPSLPAVDVPVTAAADVRLKAPTDNPEQLPVGRLLAWGDQHDDPDIRDQAARGRAILGGLRTRYAADLELAAVTSEAEQLEKRLVELRAREAELAPAKKARKKSPLDYDAGVVRAWAREQGIECPARGRVPKAVLEAWRASLPQAG